MKRTGTRPAESSAAAPFLWADAARLPMPQFLFQTTSRLPLTFIMPFLLHKDNVLSEETAASDYQRWLDDDGQVDAEAEAETDCAPSSRNEPMRIPQPVARGADILG